jgi:hypothetical protein
MSQTRCRQCRPPRRQDARRDASPQCQSPEAGDADQPGPGSPRRDRRGMVGYALDAEMGRKTFWTIRRPASTRRNSWRVTTSTGMLDGFLPAVPDRPTPPVPRVADVSAGSVGCPQPRPD